MRILFLLFAVVFFSTPVMAQSAKELAKERKEVKKISKKELNSRAVKDARKDAKQYEKDGWLVKPGTLPIEKQLDKSYLMQNEYDANYQPRFIMGEGSSVGTIYDATKSHSTEVAKLGIVNQLESIIEGVVESSLGNKELGKEEAQSVSQTMKNVKNKIKTKLGRTTSVIEIYRTLENKNVEVSVTLAYDVNDAMRVAKEAIMEGLDKSDKALKDKVDKIL